VKLLETRRNYKNGKTEENKRGYKRYRKILNREAKSKRGMVRKRVFICRTQNPRS